uniref:GRF-type domain-containing protein n=1 Tax=Chenopodium quinoa TaxID=63459 RepID=A0A803LIJ8_CHEQI
MDRAKQCATNYGSSSSRGCMSTLKCKCGTNAVVRTVKNGPSCGIKFYGCHSWPDANCGFFKWYGGVREIGNELRFQLFEKETTIAELEMQKQIVEEKVKKLQLKKENMDENLQELKGEVSQMRIELMKSSRNEKNFSLALMLSWVLFGIILMYLK